MKLFCLHFLKVVEFDWDVVTPAGRGENLLDASTPARRNAARFEDTTQARAQLFRTLKKIDFQ